MKFTSKIIFVDYDTGEVINKNKTQIMEDYTVKWKYKMKIPLWKNKDTREYQIYWLLIKKNKQLNLWENNCLKS